jgi:predicted lipoprotein
MKNLGIAIVFLAGTLSGCRKGCTDPNADNFKERAKKDDGSCVYSDNFDRGQMLNSYADLLIIPAYTELSSKIGDLKSSFEAFELLPDLSNLESLETAWHQAYLSWQHASYFEFGPADMVLLRSNLNTYPTDTTQILNNISSGSYDLDIVSNLDAKGFPALDYLLNANDESQTLALYTTDPNASSRMQYMEDLILDMDAKSSAVLSQWQSSYRNQFVASTGLDVGSSTNLLFNAFVMHYERYVRQGKLGIPAGALTLSQMPLPEKVEAFYQGNLSKELLSESFLALQNVYTGNKSGQEGVGFEEYVEYLESLDQSASLNSVILTQISEAQAAISTTLQSPLSSFVENNQQSALQVWDEMQMLVVYLKNDLKSMIGLSITYADADGD